MRASIRPLAFIAITSALFIRSSHATTTQTPDCRINGDPDVFSPGLRLSFYLQWAALVLQVFCRFEASAATRSAAVTTVSAVTINTLRSLYHESLFAVEWSMLYAILNLLVSWNLPITDATRRELYKTGGTYFVLFIILALYQIMCPYVVFHAWEYGRQPGCSVKVWTAIDAYSEGWITFIKIAWVLASVILGTLYLTAAFYTLSKWLASWGFRSTRISQLISTLENGLDVDGRDVCGTGWEWCLRFAALLAGAIGIAFLESTITENRIGFEDTQWTDSGQLVPLLVGVFSLVATVLDAVRAHVQVVTGSKRHVCGDRLG